MISAETYGENGPPIELTWNEIEERGHEIGKLTATEFDQTEQRPQAKRFDEARACPQCGKRCSVSVKHRDLEVRDGPAGFSEAEFHCVSCERLVTMGGVCASFKVAAQMIELLTDLTWPK
ncbi:hypothetical protein CA13_34540 [Planctomycetes bacterium CA13]|uniref:Uncharacterized protein n=2 Tax=Novipirellula herctigrandis TaxID=2527986 RepID=A0A5C5Z3M8_9BACT|nr:hypothetical protein CA13_34540 [Planctomycetes bacterium CA13]